MSVITVCECCSTALTLCMCICRYIHMQIYKYIHIDMRSNNKNLGCMAKIFALCVYMCVRIGVRQAQPLFFAICYMWFLCF